MGTLDRRLKMKWTGQRQQIPNRDWCSASNTSGLFNQCIIPNTRTFGYTLTFCLQVKDWIVELTKTCGHCLEGVC